MDANAVAAWFETERGISRETLRAFNVQMDRGNVIFTYPNGRKERPDPTVPLREDQRRFYFTKGQRPLLFQHPSPPASETAFLCEGETDCMRMWQELGGAYPVFGLGGIDTWDDRTAARLAPYKRVYVCLDNDNEYLTTGQGVDNTWRRIRHDLGVRAKRVYLPSTVKDVCQFFADGWTLEQFHALCQRSGQSLFKPVDFTVSPPPVRWLAEGVFAMGDLIVLSGLGGLGKSFLTMWLALMMLRGEPEFLGFPLKQHGKILYVDQENPLDVVHDRLLKMGLDPSQHAGRLRYLHYQGVRMDKEPEKLIDEAVEFAPDLVVVDSLSRIHGVEENSVGEIAPLMSSLSEVARQSGACVILIHHHDKSGKGARGSGDIVNASDGAYDVHPVADMAERMKLVPAKSRRKRAFDELLVHIEDQPDGTIKLKTMDPTSLSF